MPNDYLLDNAWQHQRARLAGLEAWFDPGTIRHVETLGVAEGWRCWEVGAGGGSIAEWLARRVRAVRARCWQPISIHASWSN